MIDKLNFIYTTILSFSGFSIAFYGIMARHKINKEIKTGMDKGFNIETDEGNTYFSKRIEKWKAGSYFDSKFAPIIGVSIALTGAGINLINNNWWTSILLLLVAHMIYLVVVELFKCYTQILSIFTLLLSVALLAIF